MNCQEFAHFIDDYISGSLDNAHREGFERHKAVCSACARQVALQRAINESLHDAPQIPAPEGMMERILAAVEAEEAQSGVIEFPAAEQTGPEIGCHVFDEHAPAYLDGLLDGSLAAAMKQHSASCPSCERLLSAHRAVAAAFCEVEPVNAPSGMSARILAAAEAVVPGGVPVVPYPLRRFRTLIAAACFFFAITALVWIVSDINPTGSFVAMIMTRIESVTMEAASLPLEVYARLAARITPEQWVLIERLAEPIAIPFVPLALPVYLFVLLAFVSTGLACVYRSMESSAFCGIMRL